MITAIVFSNNAPGSLDLFLQSAELNKIPFKFSILYNADETNEFEYLNVINKHNIESKMRIGNFKEDLLAFISGADNLIAFFKDTNYFYSELPEADIEKIMEDQDLFCFSLCLGRNTKHCYHNDVYNILLNETENSPNTIRWNWVKHYLDFGRPLELGGGHIFHKKEIHKLFKKWQYIDIQGLEASFDNLEYYPKEFMSSFSKSVLIDVINKNNGDIRVFDFSAIDRTIIEI